MKPIVSLVRKYPFLWLPALALGLSWALLAPPGLALDYFIFAEEVWSDRYPANAGYTWPVALEQASRDVYVTGISQVNHGEINHDYLTVKYTIDITSRGPNQPVPVVSVQQAWARYYNGTGNGEDIAAALALSSNSPLLSKEFKKEKWAKIGGHLYVTGTSKGVSGTGADFLTIKYTTSGTKLWERRYNSPGNHDEIAAALAVDGWGNVYVTGFSGDFPGSCNYLTIKYNASGQKLWEATYNGNGGVYNLALAVAVDQSGNVYVSGYSGDLSSLEILTVKFAPDGTFLWEARYPGPNPLSIVQDVLNNFMIKKVMLALDPQGNVVVAGPSLGAGTQHDYATVKYRASDGLQLWATRYNNSNSNGDDIPTALALDAQGNAYVTGYSTNSSLGYEIMTCKYLAASGVQWSSVRYFDPGNLSGIHLATALALDSTGNVYVAGESNGDFLIIRYTPTASYFKEEWAARKAGPAGDSRATDIATIPGSADLYVTGYSKSAEGDGYDFLTIQYHQVEWHIVIP